MNKTLSDSQHHPLIERTRRALLSRSPNEHGIVYATGEGTFHVHVSPLRIERVLTLLSSIITASTAKEWRIEATDLKGTSRICLRESSVSFSIFERIQRCELLVSGKNAETQSWAPRYHYKPTGLFTIQILENLPPSVQRTWSDGRRQRLEHAVDDFIRGIAAAGEILEWRRRAEKEWEWRSRALPDPTDIGLFRKKEAERKQQIVEQSIAWQRAAAITQLVAEVRKRSAEGQSRWSAESVDDWIASAEAMMKNIDPFENGYFARVLDTLAQEKILLAS
jgi:hypothetical protein